MGNSHEEIDIIRRTLRYCEAGTTHMESGLLRNPVSHYANAQRLAQEQAILFREFPIVVGHVSQLASEGDFGVSSEPCRRRKALGGDFDAYMCGLGGSKK